RRRVRISVWLMVAAALVALTGIFGFGGLTGAGDYFSDDEAEHAAALQDHYWQIWGILLPLAVAVIVSGVSLFILSGVLTRIGEGWPAAVTRVVRVVVIPLTLVAAVPYLLGPDANPPSWAEAVAGTSGIAAYLATVALGVAIFGLRLPTWTGVALVLGAVAAIVTYLPLFVFVGTFVSGIGILRWDARTAPGSEALVADLGR
ncbi:MAG: hypothetical protein WBL35_03160, partial [Ornithinibacter sp.]